MWFNKSTEDVLKELAVNSTTGTLMDWAFVLALSIIPLVINELVKAMRRK
ncbi:hypothetical protein [Desulfosporosinus sp. BICA1-9]|nr:hypothetical protein [Desulfosporosinus sp. BICA1-9]